VAAWNARVLDAYPSVVRVLGLAAVVRFSDYLSCTGIRMVVEPKGIGSRAARPSGRGATTENVR
jgi:hypothetical protein